MEMSSDQKLKVVGKNPETVSTVSNQRRINILAPVTSFDAARGVISSGANEIYCGIRVPGINYAGLSTRLEPCSLSKYQDLREIANYAHKYGVRVLVTTEFPFMSELVADRLKKHISSCVKSNVDGLIVTDIGTLLMVRKMGLDIPFYASTYLASMNYSAVSLLRELGVKRVILERHLTIQEIEDIVRHSGDMEIEVFVHGPGCSNINVSCYGCPNLNTIDDSMRRRGVTITSMCRSQYEVNALDGEEIGSVPILDAYTWCSICKLPELFKTGVTGFKIVGREGGREYQEQVTKIYRELLNLLERDELDKFREKADAAKTNKYVAGGCRLERCYYHSLLHAPYRTKPSS
jgi:putative protease